MKKNLLLRILIFVVIATVANVPKAKAATPVVQFAPEYLVISEPGLTSELNITVTDVADLNLWAINIAWDPSIIKVATGDSKGLRKGGTYYNIYEGPFMKSVRTTIFLVHDVNNKNGTITGLTCGFYSGSTSGSGVLAIIKFTSIDYGTTTLGISGQSYLGSSTGAEIFHVDKDGRATVGEPPPPPIWTEFWFQATTVGVIGVIVIAAYITARRKLVRQLAEREKGLASTQKA